MKFNLLGTFVAAFFFACFENTVPTDINTHCWRGGNRSTTTATIYYLTAFIRNNVYNSVLKWTITNKMYTKDMQIFCYYSTAKVTAIVKLLKLSFSLPFFSKWNFSYSNIGHFSTLSFLFRHLRYDCPVVLLQKSLSKLMLH